MSLSFHEGEIPVAVVGTKKLHLNSKEHEEGHARIELKGDSVFQQIPSNSERDVLYISGQSGSGKSFYTAEFLKQYHKRHPKRPVLIFSSIDNDKSLDALKFTKRVNIKDPVFLEMDLKAADFEGSCVVFDDVDTLTQKNIKKQVFLILDSILQTGRHYNTTVVFTSHAACNGLATRIILAECTSLTIFPRTSGNKTLNYLCDNYLGLDRHQIADLKKVSGRWVTAIRSWPRCILTERSAYMLN